MRHAWPRAACRRPSSATGPSRRSRSKRSTGSARPACALAACLPMPAMALSAPFRQALSERGLAWAVGIPVIRRSIPPMWRWSSRSPAAGDRASAISPTANRSPRRRCWRRRRWRQVSWRRGTKGRLSARFAAVRVRVADGAPQRIGDMGAQHLPGEEVWLVGEHRSSGERKYYLSNLPADTPIKKTRRGHQGTLDLRAGASAAQGRARPRPLRGALMDRSAPPRPHDDDRLRLPAIPPSRRSEGGKKEARVRRHSLACRPCGKRSSTVSPGHRHRDVRIADAIPHSKICQSSASTTLAYFSR